jgi:hypothetical protein
MCVLCAMWWVCRWRSSIICTVVMVLCRCVCVCLFNVRAEPVIKSRVLKAPKGQRTLGEEGPWDSI